MRARPTKPGGHWRRLGGRLLAAAVAVTLPMAGLAGPAQAGAASGHDRSWPSGGHGHRSDKPRIIVTQDGEVDDMDSFIRLLYYANEFDIEGIVYSSSRFHWAGDGATIPPFRWTGTEWVNHYIDLYAELYPNLRRHADGYPTPDKLRSVYKIGNIENVSEMEKVTEGSEWIRKVILDDQPGPLYVQAWGGLNTTARALKSIQEQYQGSRWWPAIQRKISQKVVVYNISTRTPRWPTTSGRTGPT